MDVTDMVDYNAEILNPNALQQSFFQLAREDPTSGFPFDASEYAGHVYPPPSGLHAPQDFNFTTDTLSTRLRLGSHLAMHIRHALEQDKGYTSTVGISTNKVLSKLVGNMNKPKGQTTLIPPYETHDPLGDSTVTRFLDGHDIGKIPGIGSKLSQKLRAHVLQRPAIVAEGLVYGATKEAVTVRDVRTSPGTDPDSLERLFAGPGSVRGIGRKIWELVHGIDDAEVGLARPVPSQISIEDSYLRLDSVAEVVRELARLSSRLIERMRIDLLADEDSSSSDDPAQNEQYQGLKKKWLAHPRTLRLTTRPRAPLNADGTRVRSFKRISASCPLPSFVFSQPDSVDALAERLVTEALVPMFRRLHPGKTWDLSLVNVGVTNMAETAGEGRSKVGRDIGGMFARQESVLSAFRVVDMEDGCAMAEADLEEDRDDDDGGGGLEDLGSSHMGGSDSDGDSTPLGPFAEAEADDGEWEGDQDRDLDLPAEAAGQACSSCGVTLPSFAMSAHRRYHEMGD